MEGYGVLVEYFGLMHFSVKEEYVKNDDYERVWYFLC